MRRLLLVLALLLLPASAAGETPRTLRVAVAPLEPYVMRVDDGFQGFSISLWEAIAQDLEVTTRYLPLASAEEVLDAVESGRAEVGLQALPITAANAANVDFSQPMFQGGLLVAVPHQPPSSVLGSLKVLASRELLHLPLFYLLVLLAPAPLVWWVERGREDGIVSQDFIPGVWDAAWWSASCLSTQAEVMPRSWLGRLVAVFWMFMGILFTSYFAGVVASSLTVDRLSSGIQGPGDLPGRRVAAVRGSSAARYLEGRGLEPRLLPSFEEAMGALARGHADAAVTDAGSLMYYAARAGSGRVRAAGRLFQHQGYGIAVGLGSPLRKPIDRALLRLQEDGRYYLISERWFASGGG